MQYLVGGPAIFIFIFIFIFVVGCRNFCSTVFAVLNVREGNSANDGITPGYTSKQRVLRDRIRGSNE